MEWKREACPVGRVFWAALAIAVVLALGGLGGRLRMEWNSRVTAIVTDYKDVISLSREAGVPPEALFARLVERGVCGLTVGELTGRDLLSGVLPLAYGPLISVPPALRVAVKEPLDRAVILMDSAEPLLPDVMAYLRLRMPDTASYPAAKQTLIVLPTTADELSDSGLLPDFTALGFADRVKTTVLFRPAPALGVDGERAAASLRWLKGKYPEIECVIPAGLVVAGYPDAASLAAAIRALGMSVAQAEFIRQIGLAQLCEAVKPNVLSLHSLVRDELIARRMTRDQVVERMVRAVHERSIRLLLMRPYDLYSAGRLEPFLEDLGKIADSLKARGYETGWPGTMPMRGPSPAGALSVSVVLAACLWSYARGYLGASNQSASYGECIVLCMGALALGGTVWMIPAVSRLAGALAAAFIATEATLWALDRHRKPLAGLIAGLLIVLAGGLCIAGYYGTTSAMLRLTPFSGVKLTLNLPPLLILAIDLKRRVHPESFTDVLKRPPNWGELLLCAALIGGALLMTVRSDNVAFVPGWEIRFREMLERALWVRPRTKEFLLGYPALILYYALIRRGWAARYREVFRIGASLGFASAVNTFCHFHTLLPLSLVRVVNGWWLGIVIGFVLVVAVNYIGGPLWKRGGRVFFD